MTAERSSVAFVTGCARSGTSILGELIGAHPDVEYRHEAHGVWKLAGPSSDGSHRLGAADATPEVVRRVRKRFRARTAVRLVIEKNPRTMVRIPFIHAVFPHAKVVHVVRDGRDVACSLMPGIGGNEWRHVRPPGWERLMADEHGAVRCAKAWRAIVELALDDLQHVTHLTVRYEDLVRVPSSVAGAILEFLELPPEPAVDAFCARIQNETAGSYQPSKQQKWFRNDHSLRVGRWRENLSGTEARAVERIVAPLMDRLGYETSAVGAIA
jgi:hypothetical protein